MIKRGKQDPLDKPKGVNYLVGHDQNSTNTKAEDYHAAATNQSGYL